MIQILVSASDGSSRKQSTDRAGDRPTNTKMADVKIEEEQKPEAPVETSQATASGDDADDNNDEVCIPAYPLDIDSWLSTGLWPYSMRARSRGED